MNKLKNIDLTELQVTNEPSPSLPTDKFSPELVDLVDQCLLKDPHQRPTAEQDLTNRIFREGNGKGLMKFCRELSVILIRQYSVNDDASELRAKLCESLKATLKCSEKQALSLVELSLELIHAKVHGAYRRTHVELS